MCYLLCLLIVYSNILYLKVLKLENEKSFYIKISKYYRLDIGNSWNQILDKRFVVYVHVNANSAVQVTYNMWSLIRVMYTIDVST